MSSAPSPAERLEALVFGNRRAVIGLFVLATALLAPVLARCDEDGDFAYLETQKEANVAWYARAGFTVVDEIRLEATPPVWCLRRGPQG